MSKGNDKSENILNALVDNGFDRDSTEKVLDNFLKHESKKVLFLKGAWGVGKTHFWNNYINSKINGGENRIIEKHYSYVSLFGAENVKDIEELIIAGSINPEANDVRQSYENLSKKLTDLFTDIPKLKEWSGLINRICRIAIDNTLICIDDLERKDEKLSLSTILGLISVLKELKNCRIVVIFNEASLSKKEDKDTLTLYREKIVDQELTFAPSIEDNFELIWNKPGDKNPYLPIFTKMNVNNIRVMQQTQWAIEYFLKELDSFEELIKRNNISLHLDFKQRLLEQICFLAVFYYQKDLAIDVLKLQDYYSVYHGITMFGNEDEQDPETEKIKSKVARLGQLGFGMMDYDCLIIDYLQNGKCNPENLRIIFEQENKRLIESDIYKRTRALWDFYWSNFRIKASEVIEKFSNFANDNINYLNSKDITDIIEIIRKLDKGKKYECEIKQWTSIIEQKYLNLPIDKMLLLVEERFPRINNELRKKILAKIEEAEGQKKIVPMISYIAENRGWNPKTFTLLNLKEISDYKEEFLDSADDNLLDTLSGFYNMFVNKDSRHESKPVIEKIQQALYEISNESILNEMRIKIRFPEIFEKYKAEGSQ